MTPLEEKRKRKNRKWIAVAVVLGLLVLGAAIFFNALAVRDVTVEGNERYTDAEIEQLVLGEGYSNTLLLMAKSRSGGFGNIPFISTLEVEALSAGHIRIRVYEKTIVGYVSYMGTNLYFDKDGMVVESSTEVLDGVPQISGLKFSEVTLYEQLPVSNPDVFRIILNLTQALDKNDVHPDRIAFADNLSITLWFGEARVLFGTEDMMDEKIANLASFVDDLKERKGTLHMENFTEDTQNLIFDGDDG